MFRIFIIQKVSDLDRLFESIRALFVCCITWSCVLCQLFWTSSPSVVCHCLCCWFVPLDASFWAELTLLQASCWDESCYSYSQAFSCIYFRLNNHYVALPLLSLGFAFSLAMYVTITIVGHLSAFRYFPFALVHIHIQCQEQSNFLWSDPGNVVWCIDNGSLEIKYLTLSAFFPQGDCSISGLQAWKGLLINHLCMQTCRLPEFRVVLEGGHWFGTSSSLSADWCSVFFFSFQSFILISMNILWLVTLVSPKYGILFSSECLKMETRNCLM